MSWCRPWNVCKLARVIERSHRAGRDPCWKRTLMQVTIPQRLSPRQHLNPTVALFYQEVTPLQNVHKFDSSESNRTS